MPTITTRLQKRPELSSRKKEIFLRRLSRGCGRRRRDRILYSRGNEILGWVRSSLSLDHDSYESFRKESRRGRPHSTLSISYQEWVWRKATDYDVAIQKRRGLWAGRRRRIGRCGHRGRRRLPSLYPYEQKKRKRKRKGVRRIRRRSRLCIHRLLSPRRWWDMKSRSEVYEKERGAENGMGIGTEANRNDRVNPESRSSILDYIERWVERQWRGRRRLLIRLRRKERRDQRRHPHQRRENSIMSFRHQRRSRRRRRWGCARRTGRLLIPNGYRNPSREIRRRTRPRFLAEGLLRVRILRRSVLSISVVHDSHSHSRFSL